MAPESQISRIITSYHPEALRVVHSLCMAFWADGLALAQASFWTSGTADGVMEGSPSECSGADTSWDLRVWNKLAPASVDTHPVLETSSGVCISFEVTWASVGAAKGVASQPCNI